VDNTKPRDFALTEAPILSLSESDALFLDGLVKSAEAVGVLLLEAMEAVLSDREARELEREAFFAATETALFARLEGLKAGEQVARVWLEDLRKQALRQFDALAQPGLSHREINSIARITRTRGMLEAAFMGFGDVGAVIFDTLGLKRPIKKNEAL
jgi:CRISPR system Cascade subunit CasA